MLASEIKPTIIKTAPGLCGTRGLAEFVFKVRNSGGLVHYSQFPSKVYLELQSTISSGLYQPEVNPQMLSGYL